MEEDPSTLPTWTDVLELSRSYRRQKSVVDPFADDVENLWDGGQKHHKHNHHGEEKNYEKILYQAGPRGLTALVHPHQMYRTLKRYMFHHHIAGTVVAVSRGLTPDLIVEGMPLAVRLGMKAMWAGANLRKEHGERVGKRNLKKTFLEDRKVTAILKRVTIREGKKYDDPNHALEHITSFVKTYKIKCSELLKPRLEEYATMNEFFHRKLKPNARPQSEPQDPLVITSAADCRLSVYQSVDAAKTFWIKGSGFTILDLVQDEELARELDGGEVAIFRLAPADYHRYHSPVHAVVERTTEISGDYYTVNPSAINENLDVFTRNRRNVTRLTMPRAGNNRSVAFVAVGAMLVGSCVQTAQPASEVSRGDELGYFAYGGSTCIAIFPAGTVQWDNDLVSNSEKPMETLVKVGNHIGRFV